MYAASLLLGLIYFIVYPCKVINLCYTLIMDQKILTESKIKEMLAAHDCTLLAIESATKSMFKKDVIWFNTPNHSTKVLFFEDFNNQNIKQKA